MTSEDTPTHKITPSALKTYIDSIEKPVVDALYTIILRLSEQQDNYEVDNGRTSMERKEFVSYVHKNFHSIKDMLLEMSVSDYNYAKKTFAEIQGDAANDSSYYPSIKISELGATSFFLRHAKEVVDMNIQVSEDDKIELVNNGKIALEEIADIAKTRGWGEMDIPELKFKELLTVVDNSNKKSI